MAYFIMSTDQLVPVVLHIHVKKDGDNPKALRLKTGSRPHFPSHPVLYETPYEALTIKKPKTTKPPTNTFCPILNRRFILRFLPAQRLGKHRLISCFIHTISDNFKQLLLNALRQLKKIQIFLNKI